MKNVMSIILKFNEKTMRRYFKIFKEYNRSWIIYQAKESSRSAVAIPKGSSNPLKF